MSNSNKLGQSILDYMDSLGYIIEPLNIVYVEGVNPDTFSINNDAMDYWNDTRNLILDSGKIIMSAFATTEPGRHYTVKPMNPRGAARIAFGQHLNAWSFGMHGVSYKHEALVQIAPVKFHRDLNKDGFRTNDKTYTEIIGLNQHTTSNAPNTIGLWSAGCLVGRYPSTHKRFLQELRKTDKKIFSTTVLNGDELNKFI